MEAAGPGWCTENAVYAETEGVETQIVRAAALAQVFNHATHHRGQVSARFAEAGVGCVSMDMQSMGDGFLRWA